MGPWDRQTWRAGFFGGGGFALGQYAAILVIHRFGGGDATDEGLQVMSDPAATSRKDQP